jgi:ATP-dependent RNA helicase RhlE
MTFQAIGVRSRTADTLLRGGISEPNAVQEAAIPALLAGSDCVIEAPTGSGKTLAFVTPLVERLRGHATHGARALVVTPTRELAAQVAAATRMVDPALRTVLCVGGVGYGEQTGGLRNAPDVVVACPGRLLDLVNMGAARLQRVEYLVLDEADEMLDQGFARDVEKIISLCQTGENGKPQMVLASATMPAWVQQMISRHLRSPARIRIAGEQEPDLEHSVLRIERARKIETLSTLLRHQARGALSQTIVFHRTKHGARKLARDLTRLDHRTGELQGNLSQNARDRALDLFRARGTDVLVATNVAARGIDVVNVGLVINYELPETPQWLTHRVGRTARNGAAGRAITFLTEEDGVQWSKLRRLGAPALSELDAERLIATGEWLQRSPRPAATSALPLRQQHRRRRRA